MGLAAAYRSAKRGHSVEVLEAAPEPGGMAAHFDLDNLSIERFYHFVCKTDRATFQLLEELGLADKMHWHTTSMGIFTNDRLHAWGNPVAMLKFPEINLLSRLRYGLFALVSTRRDRWDAIEHETARSWITRWCGREVYEKLWAPLFSLKFHEHAENISAAWIWTRVKRIGRSRRSMMREELGYIEGGSQTLVDALVCQIERMGGTIRLKCPAQRVVTENGQVTGVQTPDGFVPATHIICTAPTPLVPDLVPDLPEELKATYRSIVNIGACCLVFKLKKSVTPHFWVNMCQNDIAIPGFVEFSNLRPVNGTIVYVPYYMPVTHEKFHWSDQQLLEEAFGYLERVNPKLKKEDIVSSHVARLRYAQPICEPGFAAKIPPVQTPIAGLQIADTCFYYPEDRGISESVRLGREMADAIGGG